MGNGEATAGCLRLMGALFVAAEQSVNIPIFINVGERRIAMPEICRFLGIVISMYFDEHNPPHFHAIYNQHKAVIAIKNLNILDGFLPARVRGIVEEWAELHQDELLAMWESHEFHKISPLV